MGVLNVFLFIFRWFVVLFACMRKQYHLKALENLISFDITPGFNLCALTVLYSVANLPCSQIIHTDVSYQFLYFILHILHYD